MAREGTTVLLNSPYSADEVWDKLPDTMQRQVLDKHLDLWTIDALSVARKVGLRNRTNTILQTCFFAISGVLPKDCLLYTSPSPRDGLLSRMPSSA